jgi:DNA (cytosine-5)-methyltransferase 1
MPKTKKRTHIELFAGCGGMTVGMNAAGFSLIFANEVSPMASSTFAYNLLGVDISEPNDRIKWIHSRFPRSEFSQRLRENLLTDVEGKNTELEFIRNLSEVNDTLLIGDVRRLRDQLDNHDVQDPFKGSLDLLSGGPPCQSFSLAGKREFHNYKNRLPLDFAEVCQRLNPKVVLLENVKGILSAFKLGDKKHYAWFEVAKAFASKGFAPVCMLVNSKYYGVAQNRPRYIMLAFRKDIFEKILESKPNNSVLQKVSAFMQKASSNFENLTISDLDYYDIEKDIELYDGIVLPKPITLQKSSWISVKDAIKDLNSDGIYEKSAYVNQINNLFRTSFFDSNIGLFNHHVRKHSETTRQRFLFYQLLNYTNGLGESIVVKKKNKLKISNSEIKNLYSDLKKTIPELDLVFSTINEFEKFINNVNLTKKHSQRALVESLPSPAQLTIPDDICHYSLKENRVLTVREMARIQSFPDRFVFRSKETTGGKNRVYEVPQYTQVGNAVPPLLAYAMGTHVQNILKLIGE